jgi:hypothetical protein
MTSLEHEAIGYRGDHFGGHVRDIRATAFVPVDDPLSMAQVTDPVLPGLIAKRLAAK